MTFPLPKYRFQNSQAAEEKKFLVWIRHSSKAVRENKFAKKFKIRECENIGEKYLQKYLYTDKGKWK